jgi:glycine/D-amino acid oxidase-like deaminating enzyme
MTAYPSAMPVAVLGAGLTGCCAALELAGRGHEVALVDQDIRPMNRASLRNEGKIHLGLIYANEATAATGLLQLNAALRFRRLLERWLGEGVQKIGVSAPFVYLVAPDSVVKPVVLAAFYHRIDTAYRAALESDPTIDYLGTTPDALFGPLSPDEMEPHFASGSAQAAFRTAERAIDTRDLAAQVQAAVAAAPRITFLGGHEVRGISRRAGGIAVEGMAGNEPFAVSARQVINATWERRLALDQTLGIQAGAGVLHRLKYRVVARLPTPLRGLPSVTMVLGRYGDVVVRSDDTVYLSWYPIGLQGWSTDIEPPRDWNAACRGEPPPELAAHIAAETIAAIARWMPALAPAEPLEVDAGAIVAHGRTDVDDPSSGLHGRTRVGIMSIAGYHSVDPGKLTTAPVFALEVAERVDRELRTGVAS